MATAQKHGDTVHDLARKYTDLMAAGQRARRDEARAFVRRLPVGPSDRVLDVPCGDGFYSLLFAERMDPAGEVVAADTDRGALALVRERARGTSGGARVTDVHADIRALPFGEASFDFAWCAQSLISLTRADETPLSAHTTDALREVHRVLRAGGILGVLEHDEIHYVLLPWPGELELALQLAQRRGFARLFGNPAQLEAGRRLGTLLAKSGFQPIRRITLAVDRQGLPDEPQRAFLTKYFSALRQQVCRDLPPRELQQFDRLTDPAWQQSFFHDPCFEMTWLEFVCLGRKPSDVIPDR